MQMMTEERRPVRSNRLLLGKYAQYLIPTTITYAALSLNEFVDSMLVSNLLGSEAMAIVNLGMPLMLVMAALYALLGSGGSTVYAISAGKHDRETAGRSLTASLTAALGAGLLLLFIVAVFSAPISGIMCGDAACVRGVSAGACVFCAV